MSYSFSFQGDSKAAAKADIAAKLDEVVANQPVHANDRPLHEEAAGKFIDSLREPTEDQCISGNVNGSCWQVDGEEGLEQAGFGVNAGFALKTNLEDEAAAA